MKNVFINIFNNYINDFKEVQRLQATDQSKMSDVDKKSIKTEQLSYSNKYTIKFLNEFRNSTKNLTSNFRVKMHIGAGRWTYVPFISIINPSVSNGAKDGYYIVYLFRKDMKGVYLSLNRGKGNLSLDKSKSLRITSFWKSKLKNEFAGKRGFSTGNIELKTNSSETLEYESRHIIGKYYDANKLPSETVLMDDLEYMIQIYNYLIKISQNIGKDGDEVNQWILNNYSTSNTQDEDIEEALTIQDNISIQTSIYTPNCSSDQYSGTDLLGISEDIKSIVNLIAMSDLKPPLSVGLFGKWGSGKSFLMKEIAKNINLLNSSIAFQEPPSNKFCKHIAQIEFNAWHYVDTNLFASLVTHILENVAFFIENGKNMSSKDYIEPITSPVYRELAMSKEVIEDIEQKKVVINNKIDELKVNIEEKDSKINEIETNINNFKIDSIFQSIFLREKAKIKKQFIDILDVEEIRDFKALALQTRSATFTILGILKKLRGKNLIYSSLWMIGIIFAIFNFEAIKLFRNNMIGNIFNTVKQSILSIILPITPFIRPIKKAIIEVNEASAYISCLADEQTGKIEQEKSILKVELSELLNEKDEIQKKQEIENIRLSKLEEESKDIETGKFISKYLNEKINGKIYREHLGLINTIRKDFQFLDEYIKDINEKDHSKTEIDRIILYIDDLDRCPPEKVIEVIQAIHLLLSFELFVVIVAVDTRWISKCLSLKYKTLFFHEPNKENKENLASTYDYLEKVFQIPIIVKPINEDSKKAYIDGLLKIDNQEVNKEINPEDEVEEDDDELELDISSDYNSESTTADKHQIEYVNIQIDQYEKDDIFKFLSIIGDTPRTIKRYINIFRLLKASGVVTNENRINVLFILSVVTGLPSISGDVLSEITKFHDQTVLGIINKLEEKQDKKWNLEVCKLREFVGKFNEVGNISISDLVDIIPRVARYSFEQDLI